MDWYGALNILWLYLRSVHIKLADLTMYFELCYFLKNSK